MKADLIIHHARIYTVDPKTPWAEAVACLDGRIIATGSNDSIRKLAGSRTRLINARGRLVLPGFIDSHVHFLHYAVRRQEVNLFGVRHLDEVRRRLAEAAASRRPGEWILGWGWDEIHWDAPPHRRLLDDITPNNPVLLRRMDMHTYWLNSAALRQVGITAETPDPPHSQIERDPSGDPTGILREWNALRLVDPHLPRPDLDTLYRWTAEAIADAHALGLTGIHDQRVQREGRQSFQVWQKLNREGYLNLRVHMNIAAEHLPEAATLGLQPGFGNDRLWIGHLKAFADGTMGSRTAWMLAPYENDPQNTGLPVVAGDDLWQLADQARQAGFPLSVHAIGDRAVREVIDVYAEVQPVPGRAASALAPPFPYRIEHVQVIHPDDLPRLGRFRIAAAVQPIHLCSDWPTADRVWGDRARYAYAFRSLLENGVLLAFGSDAPVAPLNPLLGIYAAVARQDTDGQPADGWYPQERITVAEAVYAYTIGPATLSGKQHLQGSITPGKWADLVMLSQDIFDIPPEQIPATTVDLTVFSGQIVHYPDGEIDTPRRSVHFAPIFGPEYR
ncbi:MAG: amidohydrolase [Chloroflexi bacterium]|nr:MAG: amidohydrolase [Chloroflexota bacterium]